MSDTAIEALRYSEFPNSSDCISRQAAISICDNAIDLWNGQLGTGALVAVRDAIMALPSAQPERKNGKWVKEYWNGEHTRKCSSCNITQTVTTYRGKVNFNYCPYCGADMRGEQDEHID